MTASDVFFLFEHLNWNVFECLDDVTPRAGSLWEKFLCCLFNTHFSFMLIFFTVISKGLVQVGARCGTSLEFLNLCLSVAIDTYDYIFVTFEPIMFFSCIPVRRQISLKI